MITSCLGVGTLRSSLRCGPRARIFASPVVDQCHQRPHQSHQHPRQHRCHQRPLRPQHRPLLASPATSVRLKGMRRTCAIAAFAAALVCARSRARQVEEGLHATNLSRYDEATRENGCFRANLWCCYQSIYFRMFNAAGSLRTFSMLPSGVFSRPRLSDVFQCSPDI